MLLTLVKPGNATNYWNLNNKTANTPFGIAGNNRDTPWVGYAHLPGDL
jgi:hypothetical protein